MSTLNEMIRCHVYDHSGGMKFTELVAEIADFYFQHGEHPPTPEQMLATIKADDTLDVHAYMWRMG